MTGLAAGLSSCFSVVLSSLVVLVVVPVPVLLAAGSVLEPGAGDVPGDVAEGSDVPGGEGVPDEPLAGGVSGGGADGVGGT